MKQKIISLIALLVSVTALFFSIRYQIYRINMGLSVTAAVFQLIGALLIVTLCIMNFDAVWNRAEDKDDHDTETDTKTDE